MFKIAFNLKDFLLTLLTFTLVGPVVGLLGVMVLFGIVDGLPHDFLREVAAGLPVAYIVGAPSALVAGLLYAALPYALPGERFNWAIRVLAGAVLGAAGGGLVAGLLFSLGLVGVIAGVPAGAICGALVRLDGRQQERHAVSGRGDR
jgi:hypothetical protein